MAQNFKKPFVIIQKSRLHQASALIVAIQLSLETIDKNWVSLERGCNPFWSDSIDLNESYIPSVITGLTLTLGVNGPLHKKSVFFQVSHQRLLSFIKRLTSLCLQLDHHGVLSVLASVRSFIQVRCSCCQQNINKSHDYWPSMILRLHHYMFFQTDSRSEILFDTESRGSGVYLAHLDDPEHANASNTALYELHSLRVSFFIVSMMESKHTGSDKRMIPVQWYWGKIAATSWYIAGHESYCITCIHNCGLCWYY